MKLMRRMLAMLLVVASVLGLSLVAGAATVEYTDAGTINQVAAVDILSGLGVIKGYTNGTFKPGSSVTRAEVSKMLAIVLNGGEDVGEMYSSACTFADAKDHWAAGYIGYCVSTGVISGKNASTFDPEGNLSGYELSKLLLCALGYKADLNGLTGPNWDKNAHALAIKNDLLTRLNEYEPKKNITREDTCQMILNALQATMVETSGSVTDLGKLTIVSDVTNTKLDNMGSDYRGNAAGDSYMQLVESVLPELKLAPGANDVFGRPASTWKLGSKELGTYVSFKPIVSKEGGTNTKTIFGATDGDIPEKVVFYQDGKLTSQADIASMLANLGVSGTGAIPGTVQGLCQKFAGNGKTGYNYAADMVLALMHIKGNQTLSIVADANGTNSLVPNGWHGEYYYDADTKTLTICAGVYNFGKIVAIRPATYDDRGKVVTPGYLSVGGAAGTFSPLELTETNIVPAAENVANIPMSLINISEESGEPKLGAYVAYYSGYDAENGWNVVQGAELLQVATETIASASYYSSGGKARTYPNSFKTDAKNSYSRANKAATDSVTIGKLYTIHYALFSNAARFFVLEPAFEEYVYLYTAGRLQNSVTPVYQAKIVNVDGSVEIVETDKDYGPLGENLVGSLCYPTKNALGQLVLTAAGTKSGNTNVTASVTNKVSAVRFGNTTKYADENTRFIVGTVDSNNVEIFTAYNGISKAPTLTNAKYYAYAENEQTGMLDAVFFIEASGLIGGAEQEGVLFKTGKEYSRTDVSGTYYEVKGMVGKEAATYKVTAALYNTMTPGMNLFAGYTQDAMGLVSALNKISATKLTAFAPAEAGNITLNGVVQTYHENVLVYTYSIMRDELTLSSVDALYAMNTGTYDSFYTRHEHLGNKPLAAIFMVID